MSLLSDALGELIREMAGMPAQPPPSRRSPDRGPVREQSRRIRPEPEAEEAAPSPLETETRPDVPVSATPSPGRPEDPSGGDGKRGSRLGISPALLSRLRKDPLAAREALVYAEVFGPPLADRQ